MGCTPHDAEDLTQTFFSQMLALETMSRVTQEAGRLRSYLLSALNKLITQDWRNRHTQKRGGGVPVISIDQASAEGRLQSELTDTQDPVRQFNRRWALTLLDTVMDRLRGEYEKLGQASAYAALAPFVGGADASRSERLYQQAAADMGVREGHFRVLLFRLRKRFRQLLRAEIQETVADPSEVDDEIRELFRALSRA